MMNPGMQAGKSPPFYELNEYMFQELCRDLFDAEPDIATCDIYGTRGQAQYGIDLLAHRTKGNEIEVGQCKCYAAFSPSEIQKASDGFFKHWSERWSQENVRRFILFVACDLDRTQEQDKISEQRKRFASFGVRYEVWSAAKIRNRLRSHPGIVANYCKPPEIWAREICGVVYPISYSNSDIGVIPPVAQRVILNQINHFASHISKETEKRFELLLEAWREGEKNAVIAWIAEIKSDESLWLALSPEMQAKLLRFEAGVELYVNNDIGRAEALADEAHTLAPTDNEARLRALITYRKDGPKVAIALLAGQNDVESLNLRAALFLEMGQIEECRHILEFKDSDIEPNAESFRIRALSYLATRNLSEAHYEIQQATQRRPRWESVRFTEAMIHYFSALSQSALPVFLPDRFVDWPEPVDWMLIRRDDESVGHIRKAAEIFRELAEDVQKENKEYQITQTWYLACLANDFERQEEAASYCRQLLQTDPADYRSIFWGLSRNFDIELAASVYSLERLVADTSVHHSHIIALAGCYLASQTPQKAIALLDDTKSIFQEDRAKTLWTFWYIQSLAASGNLNAVLSTINSSESSAESRHGQTIALQISAQETGDWQPLFEHLEKSFKDTNDPAFILEIWRLKAQQQDWEHLAERAEEFVKDIGTSEALRMAVWAAQNAKQFELCLKLLDSYRELFREQKLPAELRRVRISCLHVLGLIPEAITEAKTLEPTTEHLLGLAHLYSSKGDRESLLIAVRQLSRKSDLDSGQALNLASQICSQDQQLAIKLWRRANHQGILDDWVGMAVGLGYQLGLDDETIPLLRRMWKLGSRGEGRIQIGAIEELARSIGQWREQGMKVAELYQHGTIPIHLLSEQFHRPLIYFYHRLLKEKEDTPDPLRQVTLLARHGGHPLMAGFPEELPKWRLHLDVTALLLSAHLGILPDVEKTFKPLYIPRQLIPALNHMRGQLIHSQPSRLNIYRQIIDLTEKKCLNVAQYHDLPSDYANKQFIDELSEEWVALFEQAKAANGRLVVSLPLIKNDLSGPPTALPEDAARHLLTCRGIIESLRKEGPLSEEEYQKAVEQSGQEKWNSFDERVPHQGTTLYLQGAVPEILADADLLDIVCERFQVFIEQRECDQIHAELQEDAQKRVTAEWLDIIISRISHVLDDGTYLPLSLPSDKTKEFDASPKEPPEVGCLLYLMELNAQQNDVIWIDDRWATGYSHWNGAQIIGINEILKALVSSEALHLSDYYAKLSQLRAANVRFIPFQSDEILYHLRQARIDRHEGVIETRELAILRRYMAACVLQGGILQKPPVPDEVPNKNGEITFPIVGIDRAVMNALTELWGTEENEETCFAYAEWILENLYIDHLGLRNLLAYTENSQNELLLVSLALAGFLSYAIGLSSHQIEKDRPIRRRYLDWVFNRIIRRRVRATPSLLKGIAEELKKSFLNAQEEVSEDGSKDLSTWILQQLYEDLPRPVKDELARDADFTAKIGIKYVIVMDDLVFEKEDFFQTARKAINGRKARITPIRSDKHVVFQSFSKSEERNAFCFYHPETKKRKIVKRDELEILLDSPLQREAVLRRHREWFDCPAAMFEHNIARIASIENPRQRIEELETWETSSAAVYYANLSQQLHRQGSLQKTDLLPQHTDGLLRHLRLTLNSGPGETFQEALITSAQALIHQEGIATAIERLSGLPVPLPSSLLKSIQHLNKQDRRALINRLLKICCSPISKFHLIHILLHCSEESPAFIRLARRFVKNFIHDSGAEEFETFLAVLKWTHEELNHRPEVRDWPVHIRLAVTWTHTHRLFTILLSVGATIPWLHNFFHHRYDQRVSFEMFKQESAYWLDITHPQRISHLPFLLTGLSYSLAEKVTEIVDENLRQFLARTVMFLDESERLQIAFSLLRDPAQMQNSLNSFLGWDRGKVLSSLLKMDLSENFIRSSLQSLIELQINKLSEVPDEYAPWGILREVFSDLPLYENVTERLTAIMLHTDFVQLCKRDVKAGMLITEIASLQLRNLKNEELRCYLKAQVMSIAQLLVERFDHLHSSSLSLEDSEDLGRISNFLIEFSRNIALAAQPSLDIVDEFVDILTQLVGTWSLMSKICKPLVLILIEELPISQTQKFWPLLVRLRAS